ASGQVRSPVTTDLSGGFRFDAVRPGNYSIQVQHEGFKTSVVPIKVFTQRIDPLKIVLALQELVSEVSVNESELTQVSTDIAENRNAATADQDILEQIPVFDQDYVAAMSAFLDAGALGTSGPQMIVNGVEVTS